MNSLRICELNMPIEYYSPISGGAISSVIMQRAKHLLTQGHQVNVLAVDNGDPVYDIGNVVPLEMPQRDSLHKIQRAAAHYHNILAHWEWPYYSYYLKSSTAALKKLAPAPHVVITHNDVIASRHIQKVLPQTPVIAWLHNEIRRPAHDMEKSIATTDLFIAVSDYIRRWTIQKYPQLSDKIITIHNGVDLESFFPRQGYLEPVQPLRVLFIGRTEPNKGPDLAADAVAQLRREGLPITLTVAGSLWWHGNQNADADPYFRSLKEKMDSAQAHYCGQVPRPQVPQLMREHDVVCVISRVNDPCPLVALEAMGAGCVVIATRLGGLPEICGDAAYYVDHEQPSTVVAALRQLLASSETLREYKQRSVIQAANSSWQRHAQRMEQAIVPLLNR